MRKEIIKTKLNKLESDVGIKEPVIFVTTKEYDPKHRYHFEVIDGENVYYDNGVEVTEQELESRCEHLIVFDIDWVESPHKNDAI
jgi:hypothetical protein